MYHMRDQITPPPRFKSHLTITKKVIEIDTVRAKKKATGPGLPMRQVLDNGGAEDRDAPRPLSMPYYLC